MKKLFLTAFAVMFACAAPTIAGDFCDQNSLSTRCGHVTQREYAGGNHTPNVVPITACLSDQMFRSIQLADGTAAWEAGFYYGRGQPEEVTTVINSPCWTEYRSSVRQHGNPGSMAIAFICCSYYCGWVGGVIPPNGQVDLRPMRLKASHDPLVSCRSDSYEQTGQYDRCSLLN